MSEPYICPMGVHQRRDEPCPRCGATEDTEDGCLGLMEKFEREMRESAASTRSTKGPAR